jgi:CheY-like chemotaxis protein
MPRYRWYISQNNATIAAILLSHALRLRFLFINRLEVPMAKILIAEDERDIRELINFTLMFAGHKLELCANGEELVQKAPIFMPDLILTDVRMPRLTGYEACRALKQNDAVKHIPVVMLTAKGQDEELQFGKEAGAYAYILKPFVPDDLQKRVGEILKEIGFVG